MIFTFLSCSISRELNGIYIDHKRNLHGDLILINEKEGEVHSWTNDLWIDNRKFKGMQIGDTVILNYIQYNIDSDVLIKRKEGLEKIKENHNNQRFKKVSQKQAKKLVPKFIYKEIFDK